MYEIRSRAASSKVVFCHISLLRVFLFRIAVSYMDIGQYAFGADHRCANACNEVIGLLLHRLHTDLY